MGAETDVTVFPDNPRILHVVHDLARGGTEGQCVSVAVSQPKQFVAVVRGGGELKRDVAKACGPLFELGIRKMVRLHTRRRVLALSEHIRRNGIDLVHTWDSDGSIFGAAAAWRAGVRWITSRRDLGEIYSWWKLALMKRADRYAAAVVVNAEAIRARLVSAGIPPERIRLIRNSVEVDRFAPDPVGSGRRGHPDSETIALVSRLDPEKDVSMALQALQRIIRVRRGAILKIAGVGRERDRLIRLADLLGLAGSVEFLGKTRNVPELLAEARLGILASRSNEGLSNAILEYMAASLPVVVTECGGNSELVRHRETGYVVPPEDAAALADAVLRVLSNPGLSATMGCRGREIVKRDHAPAAVQDAYRSLYAEVHKDVNST